MPPETIHSIPGRLEALASALATNVATAGLAAETAELLHLVRNTDDLLRLDEVKRRTGLSISEIYRREAAGELLSPRKIGARLVAWYRSDVNAWIKSRQARELLVGRPQHIER